MTVMTEESGIAFAWKNYVINSMIDNFTVRPEIAESWQRCREARVDPYDGVGHIFLNAEELESLLKKRKCLINIARPFMENLYSFVANSGFIVMLTDERGYILEAIGDSDTLADAEKISFRRGANWSEEAVGTNAIGTAMVLRKPVQTSGAEHYCQKHHHWTCSAAPIFDYYNRMIGILDMSGPSYKTHQHTLGMVVASVAAITNEINIQKKNRDLMIINSKLSKINESISDGVIIVDKSGIITDINPVTEDILEVAVQDIAGKNVADILGEKPTADMLASGKEYKDVEVMVSTASGRNYCLVSGKPVKDNRDKVIGGVIFIEPIKHVNNLVTRFSGYQASFMFKDIVGSSSIFLKAVRMACSAAANMSNVLLQGESGTGKEVFAQAIHNKSRRAGGPFVAVNCGAIPLELISSELFGYVEGAFTGAKRGGRPGKFELASGGTLFLDEIGEMPVGQQVSLLRVLQDKKITRLGGEKPIPVDVRIICATNKNLQEEVKKGNFRQDLFYRLNVISINLPPLRERREDIPLLFNYLLKEISRRLGVKLEKVDSGIMKYLYKYDWPGNVREMQNVVERMLSISSNGEITLEHLPVEIISAITGSPDPVNEPAAAAQLSVSEKRKKSKAREKEEITLLLREYRGNISRVAREMEVSRNTIYRKIRLYNITI